MRLKGIIARVLVVLASLNLVAGPVFAGARVSDGAITSGINSAVHGTSFKKGFTSSLVKNVVALGLADAQIGIGNVFNKKDADGNLVNGGEGSLGHILLHGAAGCAAAELTGARCAAGAAGGIAQAVYAGALNGNVLSEQEKIQAEYNTQLIGAIAGFFFSGGEAQNVSVASAVALSGFKNNYLTHLQIDDMRTELLACGQNETCRDDVYGHYRALSYQQDQELAACTTFGCVQYHLDRAAAGQVAFANWSLEERQALDAASGISDSVGVARDVLKVLDARFAAGEDQPRTRSFAEVKAEVERLSCSGLTEAECTDLARKVYWNVDLLETRRKAGEELLFGDIKQFEACRADDPSACTQFTIDALTSKKLSGLGDALSISYRYFRDTRGLGARNRTATSADVSNHFQQNRQFWTQDPIQFNGNKVYQRNDLIDPNQTSTWRQGGRDVTGTNLERMAAGRAPLDASGNPINLHHMTQSQNGAIAEMTQSFHSQNHGVIHINPNTIPSGIDRPQFDRWRAQYWRNRASTYGE